MPSISRGNLVKLLQVPAVALGAVASLVVQRSPERWVVGCGSGVGEGALALALAAQTRGTGVTWIARNARDERDAAAAGIPSARGPRAFVATLRAGVVVFTHGFGDVSRAGVHGAFVVNLWHGIPLKRLHRDAPGFLRLPGMSLPGVARLLRAAHQRSAQRISLFPVASHRVGSRIVSAFGLRESAVQVLGDPRDDVLVDGLSEESRAATIAHALALLDRSNAKGETTVLYAPTWRDGEGDPAVPTHTEWQQIASWLAQHDARLIIRSHPHGAGDYGSGPEHSDRIGLLGADLVHDITPALPGVDVLVTDFSSIAFDASIAGIPSVFFAPDLEAYVASRGLYDDYANFAGRHVVSWEAALVWIQDVLTDGDAARERQLHAERLVSEHIQAAGGATQRVLAAIDAALSGVPAPAEPEYAADIRAVWRDGEHWCLRVAGTAITSAVLRGPRARVTGEVREFEDGCEIRIPLTIAKWGGSSLPIAAGRWVLDLRDQRGFRIDAALHAVLPEAELALGARFSVVATEGGLGLDVAPALTEAERAPGAQRAFAKRYLRSPEPERAIMFESFYARSASCNPRAIDAAIAKISPDVQRYWSVRDGSVEVPEGAIAVIEGSEEWWRVRGSARALVVNDWLRKRWRRQPHQTVLQTWHGTPLKRLALERSGQSLRTRIAAMLESRRWDVLLAQNPHAARHLTNAYRFSGDVWQWGYPRSDVLFHGNAAAVRALLGIAPEKKIALYAPTWRDDRVGVVDHIDVASLSRELGSGWCLVVRGHARTMDAAVRLAAHDIVDATDYPDVADLLLVADALVTDYSSVMFDFAATERPIVLAVPDLEDYRDRLRGFTFDIVADAPGPVVTSATAVAQALAEAGPDDAFAERRKAWRDRFTPQDDGGAGERVARELLRVSGLLAD